MYNHSGRRDEGVGPRTLLQRGQIKLTQHTLTGGKVISEYPSTQAQSTPETRSLDTNDRRNVILITFESQIGV